jgi:hypothetical protein
MWGGTDEPLAEGICEQHAHRFRRFLDRHQRIGATIIYEKR